MARLSQVVLLCVSVLVVGILLTACVAGPYPGYTTPRSTLDTFFSSAKRLDYSATYECYYQRYHDLIPQADFVSHRKQAAVLADYRIDSIRTAGSSASATVTLTFAPRAGSSSKPRSVVVQENLVDQAGAWKIKVW